MPRMKMTTKCSRRERPPSSSSSEEDDPQIKRIDRGPVLLGKNVDLASFTFDTHSFHIEELFVGMVWDGILMLNDKVYPSIVKDFYKKMAFSPGTEITCLLRNKRVKITQDLIRSLLRLEVGGIHLYTTKTIPHTEEYNPVETCRRVTRKHFETRARLSTNQLTLMCLCFTQHHCPYHCPSKRSFHIAFLRVARKWTKMRMSHHRDQDQIGRHPPLLASLSPKDHYNMLNGRIDSLTSTTEGLHNSMVTLQDSVASMTSLLHALHSRLDAMLPRHPPPED
ncbi:Uncharacterized protein Adt_33306 [Abeliophyllum distichum]|uniref:Uncharacterized protein n=1 Tax=Abeliophyllum distichum TaxID=126358 RepID=A0ABD1QVV7_9LAMI